MELGGLGFSLVLAFLTQIEYTQAEACSSNMIVSITSPSASTIYVKWNQYPDAENYFLDVRVVNSTTIAPVVALQQSSTEKLVHGLRPGTVYRVTVKAFQYYQFLCMDSEITSTVPATSQITVSQAISSTAIRFEWSSVKSANRYFLIVETFNAGEPRRFNHSFTNLSGEVHNLRPSTPYTCCVYSSNSAGLGSRSRLRTVTTLVQPPGFVNVSHTGRSTARVTWEIVSKVLQYHVSVIDTDNRQLAFVTDTFSTFMDISNLQPCATYRIEVSSLNAFLVPGEETYTTYTTRTIGAVTSISVDYSCSSGMVTVSWNTDFGADSYTAVATDGNGTALSCTTKSASCQITSVKCGERYLVRVTSISDDCKSSSNVTADFETVPCPPAGLVTYRECSSNVIIFGWDRTNNTGYYVATALASNGEVTECRTVDTSCMFTNTRCGHRYQFTVYSVSGLCHSELSLPAHVKTAPCDPTNVKTLADCHSDVLTITWARAEGALSYIVKAHGNRGDHYNCSSFTESCAIPGMRCGESLSVWVTATDDDCTSGRALGEATETVPCTPQNVTVIRDCGHNTASLVWVASKGAVFYIASTVHSDGTVHTCTARDTECQIQGLRWGETYDAFVIATNMRCNSSESDHVTLETVPCAPSSVHGWVDCASNTAYISWAPSPNATYYNVTATTLNGHTHFCMSTSCTCNVTDLHCGKEYAFTVTASNGSFDSLASAPFSLETAPCAPTNVENRLDCDTNVLEVSWDSAGTQLNFSAVARAANGTMHSCSSGDSSCRITDLLCSQWYSLTITASNANCTGPESVAQKVQTVLCAPQNLSASLVCANNTALVTWDGSEGAMYYIVSAQGHRGSDYYTCNTTNTSCHLRGLYCGERHDTNVTAYTATEICAGFPSFSMANRFSIPACPCPPSNVVVALECDGNIGLASWQPALLAESYIATATGVDGHTHTCVSNSTSCSFTDLHCGEIYSVTVVTIERGCQSKPSAAQVLRSAICPPENLKGVTSCATNTFSLSWDASPGVGVSYVLYSWKWGGENTSYPVTCTYHSIPGLQCEERYSFWVAARDSACNSSLSKPLEMNTGPCPARNVQTILQCSSSSASVTWDQGSGATSYTVEGRAPNGHQASCNTSATQCDLEGLRCSQTYDVSVVSQDDSCDSAASAMTSMRTAPCPPQNVEAQISCDSGTLEVTWEPSAYADSFHVVADDEDGAELSCDANSTRCSMENLPCGHNYSITVAAVRGGCHSDPSQAVQVASAPCVPQDVSGSIDCVTNSVLVTWLPSSGAQSYTVLTQGKDGYNFSCFSSEPPCNVPDLRCGVLYTFNVTASNGHCPSQANTALEIRTAPCNLSAISATSQCHSDIIQVTWDSVEGLPLYIATAEGNDGSILTCSGTMSSCDLMGAQCGTHYTIIVAASADNCSSLRSPPFKISTAPCAPEDMVVHADCRSQGVLVSWAPSLVAESYQLTAMGRDGDLRECNTTDTNCTLKELHCSQPYSLSVIASTENCTSPPSLEVTFNSVPCMPDIMSVEAECGNGSAVLTWTESEGSVEYFASAEGENGDMLYCDSIITSCTIEGLECGAMYNFSVQASDGICNGSFSQPQLEGSAPCPPDAVQTQLLPIREESQAVRVTWSQVDCSNVSYLAEATGNIQGDGQEQFKLYTYWTDSTFFEFLLPCSSSYSMTVKARNPAGSSQPSAALIGTTAPCPPLAVRFSEINASTILSWNASVFATQYTVYELSSTGKSQVCTTLPPTLSCTLPIGVNMSAIEVTASNSAG